MTHRVGPVLLLLLLVGCGGDSAQEAMSAPACTCYAWEGPNEGWSRGVADFGDWAKLALHADGLYEVAHSGIQGSGGYESGRWAAKDGKITFVPDHWTGAEMWRRFYWTRYEPGTSIEWVREPGNTPEATAEGRWEPDEYQPPERTVTMRAIPCGELPAKLVEVRAETWESYLEIFQGSPFAKPEEEGDGR